MLGAISQYAGAIVAENLFDDASAATIAWFRVIGAVVVLAPFTIGRWGHWTRRDYGVAVVFGAFTAGMNMSFYVAIDHLPLGNSVAIEFIGPISVAALRTRTRRNGVALGLAATGVVLLSGTEFGDDRFGLAFIFLAAVLWAGYIVMGARVAHQARGVSGLTFGLMAGVLVTAPFGVGEAGTVVADGGLLATALLVGVLSTAIPYAIDQTVLRRISVRRFAVLQALLPVTATVMAAIALDERPSVVAAVGIVLVVAAVVVQDRT